MHNTNIYQTHTTLSVPAVHHSNTAAQRSQSVKEGEKEILLQTHYNINRYVLMTHHTVLLCTGGD